MNNQGDEECESDDPVEFLEHDTHPSQDDHRGDLAEIYFHSSGPAAEDSESEEEQKNSLSKFSHDLRKEHKEKRRRKQSQTGSMSSTSVVSTTIRVSGHEADQRPVCLQNLSAQCSATAHVRRSVMKSDIDRPKHWSNSTMTPMRVKRPLLSQKTTKRSETTPVTAPRSVQSPAGQLSFRPNFLKTPDSVPPLLLDADDDIDFSGGQIDFAQSSRRLLVSPHRSETPGRSQSRRFREGSLSHLFQQILKEQESLELQFSISLPRFPIRPEHLESSSPGISKDLLNPRTRTKHWGDLSFHSVVGEGTAVFLMCDMEVTAVSSNFLNQLQPGSLVRTHLRKHRMHELGIDIHHLQDKTLRIYDFVLVPLGTHSAPLNLEQESTGLDPVAVPPLRMLCTHLCEVVS